MHIFIQAMPERQVAFHIFIFSNLLFIICYMQVILDTIEVEKVVETISKFRSLYPSLSVFKCLNLSNDKYKSNYLFNFVD